MIPPWPQQPRYQHDLTEHDFARAKREREASVRAKERGPVMSTVDIHKIIAETILARTRAIEANVARNTASWPIGWPTGK